MYVNNEFIELRIFVNCRSSDDHREQGDNANEEADDAKVWFLETFISAKYLCVILMLEFRVTCVERGNIFDIPGNLFRLH